MALTLSGRARRLVSATSVHKNGFLHRLQQTGSDRFQFGETKATRLLSRKTNMVQELGSRDDFLQCNREMETSYDFIGEMRKIYEIQETKISVSSKFTFLIHSLKKNPLFLYFCFSLIYFKFDGYNPKLRPEIEKFQALAIAQSPKVMVIGCADSRVCPSYVLGFQPGEAFTIRNVANLITPIEYGPTETNSALEFAVTTLQVENIIVMGHSNCGGIAALMSHQNHQEKSSLVERWVMNGKAAKLRTQAASSHLSFDEQCRKCEKESIKDSVMNLITYPWIRERVKRGEVRIHGCYYNLSDCSLERWRLSPDKINSGFCVSDREIWT